MGDNYEGEGVICSNSLEQTLQFYRFPPTLPNSLHELFSPSSLWPSLSPFHPSFLLSLLPHLSFHSFLPSFFLTGSHYVAQAGLMLEILPFPLSKWLGYRCCPPGSASFYNFSEHLNYVAFGGVGSAAGHWLSWVGIESQLPEGRTLAALLICAWLRPALGQ